MGSGNDKEGCWARLWHSKASLVLSYSLSPYLLSEETFSLASSQKLKKMGRNLKNKCSLRKTSALHTPAVSILVPGPGH